MKKAPGTDWQMSMVSRLSSQPVVSELEANHPANLNLGAAYKFLCGRRIVAPSPASQQTSRPRPLTRSASPTNGLLRKRAMNYRQIQGFDQGRRFSDAATFDRDAQSPP